MVFSEPFFLFIFLPLALLLISISNWIGRGQRLVILIFSLAFYYWSSGLYVLVLVTSILVNWWVGCRLEKSRRKRLFFFGLAVNLGTLACFKYSFFVASNWDAAVGTSSSEFFAAIVLPIGISFFSFQGSSYLIDVWRGEIRAEQNPITFGAYLSFFPQLIAGPIIRFRDVIEDYRAPKPSWNSAAYGSRRFIHGLAKKVVIADSVGLVADACFNLGAGDLTFTAAWVGALAYTLQIYFDFSGYSDMAIGLAAICGISLHENFERPYASATLTEFWRRWHISLSSWFRDYLYIPLGGNQSGRAMTYRNLFLVFLVTGLWHGAAWNFVAWGAYHGLFLMVERLLFRRDVLARAGWVFRWLYALPVVVFGWVLFRAETLPEVIAYWKAMTFSVLSANASLPDSVMQVLTPYSAVMLGFGAVSLLLPRDPSFGLFLKRSVTPPVEFARTIYLLVSLILCGVLVLSSEYSPFLYFRF